MISAIMLAAGEARRMGQLKQLLPLGKSTIIEQTLDNLLASEVDEVILVLGFHAEDIRERMGARPVKVVVNPSYREGMSTSIISGLNQIYAEAQAIMLVLADQPFIDSQTINRLLTEFGKNAKGITVPTYRSKRGHPVIISMKYKAELLKLKGDVGARDIIERHPGDVLEVPVDSPDIFRDVDNAYDYHSCLGNITID